MNNNLILPIIIFLTMTIFLIISLIVINIKKKNNYKKTIEDLDYEKNKLIGVPILLIIWGMLDFAKSVIGGDEDKIKADYYATNIDITLVASTSP